MNGYLPKRISNHAVEQAIQGYSTISDARAFTYQENGHEFYCITFPSATVGNGSGATWVYDAVTDMWHKRAYRDNFNNLNRHRPNCAAEFGNLLVVGDFQNGNLYSYSLQNYTDNGQPIWRMRRAPHITDDLKRVFYEQLQIQFQPGVGIQSGQGSTPKAMLRWSDDGGFTWSNEHWTNV